MIRFLKKETKMKPMSGSISLRLRLLNRLLRLWLRPRWVEHGQFSATLEPGVYIVNYASWADNLILAGTIGYELADAGIPFHIAQNTRHKKRWSAKLTRFFAPVYDYNPTKPDEPCNDILAQAIRDGETVLMLPESRPTNTGALLPVCDILAAMLADANPVLHPFYLHGTGNSPFSAVKPRQCRTKYWPKLTINRFSTVHLALLSSLKGRARTKGAADQLYDLLSGMAFAQFDYQRTLFESIIDAAKTHGFRHIIAEDAERTQMSYAKLLIASYALGETIVKDLDDDEATVGLLMPNVLGGLLCFTALQAYAKTPAILNFTAGRANMVSASETAAVKTVLTARRFVKAAELEDTIEAMEAKGIRILYVDELRRNIRLKTRMKAIWRGWRGLRGYEQLHENNPAAFDADNPAVILFTSGSEGAPKGVVLTHANLMTNIAQLQSRIDFGAADCIFNPLPLFHTSGLTGGILLPLMSGMKLFLYPSPLHYQAIPELIADAEATVLFATDTFLSGYARYARPHDLHRLRYVFAGAERLKPETRHLWADKFGVRVLEGYGVTETAPVLAFNTPTHTKPGTVGRLAPGIDYRLEPVEGIEDGGRLVVQASNVMAGYLLADNPGTLVPAKEGWHDTGDIVKVDSEGFVTILGRAKRFAKIGGEMISLGAVEQAIKRLWPEADHAVINLPDKRKGEILVLMTTQKDASKEAISTFFRDEGLPDLYVPRQVITAEAIPLLGSGKTDYPAVSRQVTAHTGAEKTNAA